MSNRNALKHDAVISQLMIRRMVNDAYNAANKISPMVAVSKKSDLYYIFDDAHTRLEDTAMDAQGGTNEIDFDFTTDSYRIQDYGLKKYIHPDLLDETDETIMQNIREATAQTLTDLLTIDKEYRASRAYFNTTTMSGRYEALSSADAVNNPNSDIVNLYDQGIEDVRMGCGRDANTTLMSKATWRQQRRHPELIKLLGDKDTKRLTLQNFKDVLSDEDIDMPNVIVAGQTYNTSPEGVAAVYTDIWTDGLLLAYVDPNVKTVMENTFAKTFIKKEAGIKVFFYNHYDSDKEGIFCKALTNYVFKIVNKGAGKLFTNVLK